MLVLLTSFTLLTASRHELGHDEAQAWNIARAADTPLDVIENGRLEGHTPFWHMVLWVASRGGEPFAMQLLAVALTSVAVFLLLRDRPFPLPLMALLASGYFVAYEYAIVPRPYVLTLVLTALLASRLRGRRSADPVPSALICGLVAMTGAFGVLLSVPLVLASLSAATGLPSAGISRVRRAAAAALYFAFAMAAIWFVLTPLETGGFETLVASGGRSGRFALESIFVTPVFPHADRLPLGVGKWLANDVIGETVLLIGAAAAYLAVAVLLRRDRMLLICWALALVLLFGGSWFSGFVAERQLGHVVIAALALCWMGSSSNATPDVGVTRGFRHLADPIATVVIAGVLLYHVVIMLAAAGLDLMRPQTSWKQAAELVEATVPPPRTVLLEWSYESGALLAYLDEPAYDIRCDCLVRFYSWDRGGPHPDPKEALAEAWCDISTGGRRVVLVNRGDGFVDDARLQRLGDLEPGYRDPTRKRTSLWTLSPTGEAECAS